MDLVLNTADSLILDKVWAHIFPTLEYIQYISRIWRLGPNIIGYPDFIVAARLPSSPNDLSDCVDPAWCPRSLFHVLMAVVHLHLQPRHDASPTVPSQPSST